MATRSVKSRTQLQAELEEANTYIEELESKLDDISGIASGETGEDDEEEEEEEED